MRLPISTACGAGPTATPSLRQAGPGRRAPHGQAGQSRPRIRLAVRRICGSCLNPRPARSVSPVAVSAVRKGLGSDEETGVQRTNAGLGRPRLHADGARVRQARGGRPSDARPLVPDPNRSFPAPAAAAVVSAAPTASRSRNRQLTPEFTPVQGQWTRSVNYPVPAIRTAESQRPGPPRHIKIINPRHRLPSPYSAHS